MVYAMLSFAVRSALCLDWVSNISHKPTPQEVVADSDRHSHVVESEVIRHSTASLILLYMVAKRCQTNKTVMVFVGAV